MSGLEGSAEGADPCSPPQRAAWASTGEGGDPPRAGQRATPAPSSAETSSRLQLRSLKLSLGTYRMTPPEEPSSSPADPQVTVPAVVAPASKALVLRSAAKARDTGGGSAAPSQPPSSRKDSPCGRGAERAAAVAHADAVRRSRRVEENARLRAAEEMTDDGSARKSEPTGRVAKVHREVGGCVKQEKASDDEAGDGGERADRDEEKEDDDDDNENEEEDDDDEEDDFDPSGDRQPLTVRRGANACRPEAMAETGGGPSSTAALLRREAMAVPGTVATPVRSRDGGRAVDTAVLCSVVPLLPRFHAEYAFVEQIVPITARLRGAPRGEAGAVPLGAAGELRGAPTNAGGETGANGVIQRRLKQLLAQERDRRRDAWRVQAHATAVRCRQDALVELLGDDLHLQFGQDADVLRRALDLLGLQEGREGAEGEGVNGLPGDGRDGGEEHHERSRSTPPALLPHTNGLLVEWSHGAVGYTRDIPGLMSEQRLRGQYYFFTPPLPPCQLAVPRLTSPAAATAAGTAVAGQKRMRDGEPAATDVDRGQAEARLPFWELPWPQQVHLCRQQQRIWHRDMRAVVLEQLRRFKLTPPSMLAATLAGVMPTGSHATAPHAGGDDGRCDGGVAAAPTPRPPPLLVTTYARIRELPYELMVESRLSADGVSLRTTAAPHVVAAFLDEAILVSVAPLGRPHRMRLLPLSIAFSQMVSQQGGSAAAAALQAVRAASGAVPLEGAGPVSAGAAEQRVSRCADAMLDLIMPCLMEVTHRRVAVLYELLRMLKSRSTAPSHNEQLQQYITWFRDVPTPSLLLRALCHSPPWCYAIARRLMRGSRRGATAPSGEWASPLSEGATRPESAAVEPKAPLGPAMPTRPPARSGGRGNSPTTAAPAPAEGPVPELPRLPSPRGEGGDVEGRPERRGTDPADGGDGRLASREELLVYVAEARRLQEWDLMKEGYLDELATWLRRRSTGSFDDKAWACVTHFMRRQHRNMTLAEVNVFVGRSDEY